MYKKKYLNYLNVAKNEIKTFSKYIKNFNINEKISIVMILMGLVFFFVPIIDYVDKLIETDKYLKSECTITKLYRVKHVKSVDTPVLEYIYQINGEIYKSDHFSYGIGNIKLFEQQYPERKVYPVYYDPTNPTKSVLVKGSRKHLWDAPMTIGFIFIIFGIIGLLSSKNKICKEIWDSFFG
ncbi:MAG: DUF3592 domain-containing protein [Spirochaetaceae bacterium]